MRSNLAVGKKIKMMKEKMRRKEIFLGEKRIGREGKMEGKMMNKGLMEKDYLEEKRIGREGKIKRIGITMGKILRILSSIKGLRKLPVIFLEGAEEG